LYFAAEFSLLANNMPRQSSNIKPPKTGIFRVIGLMSGTSMDGIDVALIETDGQKQLSRRGFATYVYPEDFRIKLRAALGKKTAPAVEKELTKLHAQAVKDFLKKKKLKAKDIHALGFHGHTLFHKPEKKTTVQIGDGKLLARLTSIPVVWDFRTDDVKAGGQGAPLVPVYHRALAGSFNKPCAFVNIGGVANITYIGERNELLAFDTGPGNALLDDWVLKHTGKPFDDGGKLARQGKADKKFLKKFLKHSFFGKKPPKSLDRDDFASFVPKHLKVADGAATLAAMTALSIAQGLRHLPKPPKFLAITGGGRKNSELLRLLKKETGCAVLPVEKKKLNGDAMEAEAFAYLAVRVIKKMAITFPGTTGRKK
jgi:anhydro-N-acetylmuramic acid kinase